MRKIREKKLEEQLAVFIFMQPFIYYTNYVLDIIGVTGYASRIGYPLITIYAFIVFIKAFAAEYRKVIFITCILFALLASSIYLHDNTILINMISPRVFVLSDLNVFVSIVLPVIWIALLGVDYKRFLHVSRHISILLICMQLFIFIATTALNKKSISNDYMSYSYSALLPFFICYYYRNKNVLQRVTAYIALGLQLIAGCRGAMLTAITFCFLFHFIKGNASVSIKTVVKWIATIIVIYIFISQFDSLVTLLYEFLKKIGFSSRTLSKIQSSSDQFWSSQRTELYSEASKYLSIIGVGIYGDRPILGTYAHNWIMEILLHFGIAIGALFVLCVICQTIYTIMLARKSNTDLIIVYELAASISYLFVKYMLSSSYLISSEFFLSILFLLDAKRRLLSSSNEKRNSSIMQSQYIKVDA